MGPSLITSKSASNDKAFYYLCFHTECKSFVWWVVSGIDLINIVMLCFKQGVAQLTALYRGLAMVSQDDPLLSCCRLAMVSQDCIGVFVDTRYIPQIPRSNNNALAGQLMTTRICLGELSFFSISCVFHVFWLIVITL